MILSGADVKQYIAHGGLQFSPSLSDDQFQQNGVDLILAEAEHKVLCPGMFTLGRTLEFIQMPNDLMAFVQLRSTWARKGFMLPPTVVDAGFHGTITLEIVSFAQNPMPIGERFVHLIFAKLTSPSEPYRGKYQGQIGITNAIGDENGTA
jgi:dCTP deaminase